MGLLDEAGKRVQELLDRTDIDEKLVEAARAVKRKGQEILDRTDIDERIAAGADTLQRRMGQLLHGQETAGTVPEEEPKPGRVYGVQADVPVLSFDFEQEEPVEPEEPEQPEQPEEPQEP